MVSRIQIITNANDTGVNNNEIRQLASLWGRFGNPTVHLYEFARELGLNHDFITPERLGDQIDRIYQILLDLIAE
jgi:DNA-binding transcriptional MerR regulator